MSAADSLINCHINPPVCQPSEPLPAACNCGHENSCGRPRFGASSTAAMFDTPYTYSCANTTMRYRYLASLSVILVFSISFISLSPLLDNIRVMMIVWRLRGNIIRTALCWIVWHSVHSQQHTYVSSSYRFNRLGLSHWYPYAVRRGGCLELYYCNMVEWFWWDSSLIFDDQLVSFSALTLFVWLSDL